MNKRMVGLIVLFSLACANWSWCEAGPNGDQRLAPPKSLEQSRINRKIHEKYKADFESRDAADRDALAHKLHDAAAGAEVEPATRYVLLLRARDCAVNAGDFIFMFVVVDEIAKQYSIDGEEMKASGISMGLDVSSLGADELGEAYCKAAESALTLWNLDLAHKSAYMVHMATPGNRNLVARADALEKTIRQHNHELAEVLRAERRLTQHPGNPADCLLVGKHLCFNNNLWEKGLPFLAKSGDSTLSELARRDLAGPTDARSMAALADEWWKANARQRAAYWYAKALPGLEGEKKAEAERRIAKATEGNREHERQGNAETTS